MQNLLGLLYSFGYVFAVIGLAKGISIFIKGKEISRKVIHILCGNWMFFAFYSFDSYWYALIPPLSFILINYISYRKDLIAVMESRKSMGTVYYAVSLFLLTGLGYLLDFPAMAYVGILSMAYGDGFAAVIGEKYGKIKWNQMEKSYVGSAVVFIFTFLVVAGISLWQGMEFPFLVALLCGIAATYLELFGDNGMDNLALPLGVAVLYYYFYFMHAQNQLFLFIGIFVVTVLVLALATLKKSITPLGSSIAFFVGLLCYAHGGLLLYGALLLFFMMGSLSSKYKKEIKAQAEKLQERIGTRDWQQVLANSLPILVVLWLGEWQGNLERAFLVSFAVLAAAAADTISSDLGILTKGKTFSLFSGKEIPKGLSGGVSVFGLWTGLVAAVLMGVPLFFSYGFQSVLKVIALGFLGTVVDSFFGEFLQVKYMDKAGNLTERKVAENGDAYPKKYGLFWLNNDGTNLVSLSMIAMIAYYLF